MPTLVFDTGPIISLALNNLLSILPELKRRAGGEFLIPPSVKRELVDRPIEGKKFKFEALQVLSTIEAGTLTVRDTPQARELALKLMDTANQVFIAGKDPLQIIHFAEMEALAITLLHAGQAMVVDERTTRMIIENPERLRELLERKLNTRITMNRAALQQFHKLAAGVKFLRSTELAVIAYEFGLLDAYVLRISDAREQLLQGVLWGLKLSGCGITQREIDTIVKIELQ